MTAASQIIGYAEKITKIDKDSVPVPGLQPTMLYNVCNKAVLEYYNAHIKGGGEPPANFKQEFGGTITSGTALDGAVSSGATTITVDDATNAVDAGGAAVVWDNETPDIFEYTDGSTTTFTGVTGISFDHEDDDAVEYLYKLPANFDSFRSTHDSPDGVEVEGVPYIYQSGEPVGNRFEIYDNGTNKFLFFPRGVTGDFFVYYNALPTTVDEASDNVDIPVSDEDFAVYRIAEHIARVLQVDTREYRALGDKIIADALKRRNIGKRVRFGRKYHVNGRPYGIPPSELVNQFYA